MKRVEVEWRDACLWTRQLSRKAASRMPLAKRRTLGWLVRRSKHALRIAMTRDADGKVDDVYVIPLDWATKVRYLRKGRD